MSQSSFPERVIEILAECGLPGNRLQIELTENVLMQDVELCSWVLDHLRENLRTRELETLFEQGNELRRRLKNPEAKN